MSDRTLLLPSQSYNPAHERLRNRRIEEVMRRQEMNLNDKFRALFVPACNAADLPTNVVAGVRGFVLDATSATFNAAVVGGGANAVPIFHNGTSWRVG